ncbi:3-hydroxyacyl-CoA dehydrogenase/enoyl-CoA hydratase family protein [Anaeromyxobacter oryzae]|uniref:3-hydroxyacyl-CoA dehydrogenase n=1 Tax=Anaeromyxobacter oryzae TaxID=2918170 RepID=A0ABM7WPX4_9BACT|nr:3-hydroxyacyl-CoA dehydrogenase/enoyl-CoA hydratase family protein [Anaeromyxobacter oryzae]BDG01506.1 3-hydroxyacyl-CoA dehydrogenase [Anaeromyxobacter oryzae]
MNPAPADDRSITLRIDRVAVLGAGVMGATIAAHLANAGLRVLLLDVVPKEPTPDESAAGLTLNDRAVRNRVATAGRAGLAQMRPSPLYLASDLDRIEVGNLEDDLARLRECDWVVEVVVENLAVKRQLLGEKVAPHVAAHAVLSTNTSGLSVNALADALPASLRPRFLVTHFFNPPRYMRLLEIVPSRHTDPEVTRRMAELLRRRLGKGIVHGKDTPNFVANRIGVFAMCNAIHHMLDLGLTVEEVDAASGPATARPKSACFRTADLVGIDTLLHVARNSFELLPDDPQRETFRLPGFVTDMVARGLLGDKAKQGFYRRTRGEKRETLYFDHRTGEYVAARRPRFASVDAARGIDDPAQRLRAVLAGSDAAATLAWRNLRDTLLYAFERIPDIADDVVNVDHAMRWGFSWELGPFEMLDAIGAAELVRRAEADGVRVPERLRSISRFYAVEDGRRRFLDLGGGGWRDVPVAAGEIDLRLLEEAGAVVERNAGASVLDLGDGVFCLEFHSKMNAIGGDTLSMVHRAVRRAEAEGQGLVIANQGKNFSVGANLALLVAAIAEGAWDDVALTVSAFQKATMALKYSRVPVVAAPHGLALGGGCELCLHADAMNPLAETYMGLVEVGVGLLPAGGGTKELALRAIRLAEQYETDVSPFITKSFTTIAMAKVSTSAAELESLGLLRHGDGITLAPDRLIHDAKQKVLALAASYRPSQPASGLPAPGRSVAASIATQLWNMRAGGFISEHDETIGRAIAGAMTGGDVPAGTLVTEQWLLDLEREAFLRLCGERKTLERIQHMLKKGKPLRN